MRQKPIVRGIPRGYPALVIRPVTPGRFRNRVKRGANDSYNHSHIHAPMLNQGRHICVNLRSLYRNCVRHETSNKRFGLREHLDPARGWAWTCFTKGKLAREVSLPALEKIDVSACGRPRSGRKPQQSGPDANPRNGHELPAWLPPARICARRCGLPSKSKRSANNMRWPFRSERRACSEMTRSKRQLKNLRSTACGSARLHASPPADATSGRKSQAIGRPFHANCRF
jgi:hypothetical protein